MFSEEIISLLEGLTKKTNGWLGFKVTGDD